jgi:N-hydroxyarylamine O-acetyltransferase
MTVDLAAYRARIGWQGAARQDLATLEAVLAAHTRAIPFENLDVLLGRGIALDLPSLEAKLVHARRGGYCFEHATLCAAALEALGFDVERHIGRVVLTTPRDAAPRTHMFVVVTLDGARYVADPGFGSLAARVPLRLEDGRRAAPGQDPHWMARDGDGWKLCAMSDGTAVDCWISALDAVPFVDFVVSNHYTSTFPASPFVNRLMMHAVTDDGRVAVMNRDVTIRRGGDVERRQLADRRELRALVAAHFGFDMPGIERVAVPSVAEWS